MSLQSRKELLNSMRERYQKAIWQEKVKWVDGFMAATGYARKYAITQLNRPITQITAPKSRRGHSRYDEAVKQAIVEDVNRFETQTLRI